MQVMPPSAAALAAAGRCLQEGQLVAFPTETVYGLGADATHDRAVARLFAVKGRPTFNPLIVHVADPDQVAGLARLVPGAEDLMRRFWPGPLTLVLPRAAGSPASLLCSAGLDTLAVRCPAHPVARAMIDAAGVPVAAPSANKSGYVSPTTAAHVVAGFGEETTDIALLIADQNACAMGLESTVLDLTASAPTLLRPGAVLREELETVLGRPVTLPAHAVSDAPHAPGQLASHYAPTLSVRLNVTTPLPGEAYLGFGPSPGATLNLSESADLHEAAAHLFAHLRTLDGNDFTQIAVAPIPETGLGIAINDRLRRAASPREVKNP